MRCTWEEHSVGGGVRGLAGFPRRAAALPIPSARWSHGDRVRGNTEEIAPVSPQRIGSHAPTASIPLTLESTPLRGEVKSRQSDGLVGRSMHEKWADHPPCRRSGWPARPGPTPCGNAREPTPTRANLSAASDGRAQRRAAPGALEDDAAGRDEDDEHHDQHPRPVLQGQTLVVRPRRSFLGGCECRVAHRPHYRCSASTRLQPNGWTDLPLRWNGYTGASRA